MYESVHIIQVRWTGFRLRYVKTIGLWPFLPLLSNIVCLSTLSHFVLTFYIFYFYHFFFFCKINLFFSIHKTNHFVSQHLAFNVIQKLKCGIPLVNEIHRLE